jgi:peptide/nickel transport system permease protein
VGSYIARRFVLILPTLLAVSIVVFLLVRFVPGDVVDQMVSDMQGPGGQGKDFDRKQLEHMLGLDVPVYEQYGRWISGIVIHGDMGKSLRTGRAITDELGTRLPVTAELGTLSLLVALAIAIPLGTYSAIRQDTLGDYVGRSVGILAISLPSFWVATMLIVYGSSLLGWSPPIQFIPIGNDPAGNLGQFIVPACVLGMVLSGTTMRMCRTMMLEVLRQDYIRTAWAKGLNEWLVINRHAMKNALIPVVTIVGVLLPVAVAGSVIIEVIFGLPGMGRYLIDALNQRDYPVVSGITLVIAAFIVLNNLFIDLVYGFLDPRVQYS